MRRFKSMGAAVVFAALVGGTLGGGTLVGGTAAMTASTEAYRPPVAELEDDQHVPMPPGFGVQHSDVDGPVFVDSRGMTLYIWPLKNMRNGDSGEQKGKPACGDTKSTVTAGLMSPYPGNLELPDLDTRPTCVQLWPPVYADADAKPVGSFSIATRKDGRKQWAYNGYALYTSVLDKKPGQVNGGADRDRDHQLDAPGTRRPVGPPPNVPPAFSVRTVATGRILSNRLGNSVYTWDGDADGKSNCGGECLTEHIPVPAGVFSLPQGEWSIVERSSGVKQWAFRGKPLYTYSLDTHFRSLEGSDVHGWHNAYAQKNPDPPAEFTVHDSRLGQVLADKNGMTIYTYRCGDDSVDQLSCDHPTDTQAYRLAVCGNGDVDRCNRTWRYVIAPADATSKSLIWRAAWIDPKTGRFAEANAPGALYVWTFRDRPIYTHAEDLKPGDTEADAWGEGMGFRNGLKAFWLRDDFLTNTD